MIRPETRNQSPSGVISCTPAGKIDTPCALHALDMHSRPPSCLIADAACLS